MRAENTLRGTVTIASGASLSGPFALQSCRLFAVLLPAEFDGTTISFQVSADGITYFNLYKEGSEYNPAASASRAIAVDPVPFKGFNFVKVRAGTAAAGTAQTTTDTVIGIVADVADA